MPKLSFLVKANDYDVTRIFAQGLASALEELGVRCSFLNFDEGEAYASLQKIWEEPPDMTCSFSDITFGNRQPIADLTRIPHLCLLVDPAIYFLHQLRSKQTLISYVDAHDGLLLDQIGFKNHFFLPHGGDPAFFKDVNSPRPFEAVYFGSCIDFESLEQDWKSRYSPTLYEVLKETCKKALSPNVHSLLFLLGQTLDEYRVSQKTVNLPVLHQEVDQYIRGRDRIELLKALKSQKIHIWGSQIGPRGWDYYLGGEAHVSIHSALPFIETIPLMQQAHIVLNSSPRFKSGAHERLFYGSICGALVATSESQFPDKPFHLHYQGRGWEALDQKLCSLSLRQILSMAEQDQVETLARHTWRHRAAALISHIN